MYMEVCRYVYMQQSAKMVKLCFIDGPELDLSSNLSFQCHKIIYFVCAVCATKEGEVGDFLDPKDSADILAFGYQLAKTQGAPPKVIDTQTLQDYLESPQEMAPVNAIVGGVLANEVLKAVSGRGEPFDNLFLYSMADGGGMIERLAPAVKVVAPMSALASRLDHKTSAIPV